MRIAIALTLLLPFVATAQELVQGPTIDVSGLPGPLVLTGEAKAILVGKMDGQTAVAAAIAPLGKGKLIAFGHESFLSPKAEQTAAAAFQKQLIESMGPKVRVVSSNEIRRETLDALRTFVEAGGVLITGAPGWGWQQLNPGKSLQKDFGPSLLYAEAGIHWTTLTFDSGNGFSPANDTQVLNASDALAMLRSKRVLSEQEQMDACQQLQFALDALPADDRAREGIAKLVETFPVRWPSDSEPVKQKDAMNRLAIRYALDRDAKQPKRNPAADDFPGAVAADAKRVTREMQVDRAMPGWFVPGLYAAPGEVITVTVPREADTKNFKLRIGSTTCKNWPHGTWTRAPVIDREQDLKPGVNRIASSFGGTIYIDVPEKASGTMSVTIAGGVEQPVFRLGVDSDESWKTIRDLKAPWAELICPGIAISLPSEYIRTLDNPTALMQWWQTLAETQDKLSPRPRFPKRGERVSLDREICVGYMHAGYPIMCGLDVAKTFVDLETLKSKGNWGIYHELGHNHQWPDWTFENTGEVTNNIFSLYSFAKLNPGVAGHEAMSEKSIAKAMAKYWSADGPAGQYGKDPFYALMMYQQVIDRFGFEPFERFFDKASKKAEADRPRNDLQKRDAWLVDLSNEVGHNLEPLFTSWGVVTSDEAKAKVAGLPVFEVKR